LLSANARLDQTDAAAQTLGPALGGGLVGLLGAPLALLVDSVSYLVDAALIASVRVNEPRAAARTGNIGAEIREGLKWTYRHRTLGPLAVSTHIWFIANGAAMTVLSLLALRTLGFSAFTYGLLLTVFGIASLIGASLAPALGARLGPGRVIVIARVAYPIAWLIVAIAPPTLLGEVFLFVALSLQGLAMGTENSPEQVLWQTLTPDDLLGRTNPTRRSGNRTLAAIGALTAGLLVGLVGDRSALIGVILVFTIAALTAVLSPLREAPTEA
jgi:predicted MFS family arabinose efflux permease